MTRLDREGRALLALALFAMAGMWGMVAVALVRIHGGTP